MNDEPESLQVPSPDGALMDAEVELRAVMLNLNLLADEVTHETRPEDWAGHVVNLARQTDALARVVMLVCRKLQL